MKVNLLLVKSTSRGCLNKDLAGGMGTRTIIGDSCRARLLEFIKTRSVRLPLISLAYIASIFSQKGHQVEYLENKLSEGDLFLIPSSVVDYKQELKYARKIKKKYKNKVKVGFYGPFAGVKPEIFLKEADFVIKGEPEAAVLKIAKRGRIPQGVVKSKFIKNLDQLPFPRWDFFPLESYSYFPVINKKNMAVILTSRGCPFSCGYYCPYALSQGKKWRFRSVRNVIEEMKILSQKYQVRGLDFRDPNFTLNKNRALEIGKAMIKNHLNIEWSCETHLNALDEPLLKTLKEAGLRNINVGIESSDEGVLKNSHRQKTPASQEEKMIKICHNLGIKVAAFYILGLPADTLKSVKKTTSYAKRLNTTIAQFTICTPYPGTPFYNQVKDRITSKNWQDFNAYTPVFRHQNLSKRELLKLKEFAWIGYYFRISYLFGLILRVFKNVFNHWRERFFRPKSG